MQMLGVSLKNDNEIYLLKMVLFIKYIKEPSFSSLHVEI